MRSRMFDNEWTTRDVLVTVVADDRERRGPVVEALHASPRFRLRVERLPLGDYRVDNRFLFERKTMPDLVASIVSGRLFRQALRLVELEALRPALILEGTASDWRESGVRREAVQGALVTLTLFFGLPVLRARSAAETIRIMEAAAVQARTAGRNTSRLHLAKHLCECVAQLSLANCFAHGH